MNIIKEINENTKIEPNSLVLGNCLEVMKYIPDGSVDMILADPHSCCKYNLIIASKRCVL